MSITDELREWCVDRVFMGNGYAEVLGIADRIDTAHRSALEKLAAQLDTTEPDCAEDRAEPEEAVSWKEEARTWERRCKELIVERDERYIELPVDADGVPIHVGDKIEYLSGGRDIVRFVTFNHGGWLVNERGWEPFTMRHHRAQTVEDVLRECIANVCRSNAQLYEQGCSPLTMEDIDEELDEYINEYAARLRLAGDGE